MMEYRRQLIDDAELISLFLTVAQDLRQCLDTRFIPCAIMHQQHHHRLFPDLTLGLFDELLGREREVSPSPLVAFQS